MSDTSQSQMRKILLQNEIKRFVNERFEETRRIVLLSLVGQSLSRDGIDVKGILHEQKLADFIRDSLSDSLSLVALPTDPKVIGAYPIGVDLASEIDPFGTEKRKPISDDKNNVVRLERIKREVWAAFSHRLSSTHQRAFRLKPIPEYIDFEETEDRPNGYPIPRDLIVPPGGDPSTRNAEIFKNISAWSANSGIPFSDLLDDLHPRRPSKSALDVMLSSLGESDLARISLPLDIVNKLRIKRA